MTLNNQELVQAVNEFAASISEQPLGLAHHCPQDAAKADDSIANVAAFIEEHGGTMRFGWCFHVRPGPEEGHYLIATHHTVWHNPDDGHLVNLTPYHAEVAQQPVTHKGELLFLVDDAASPREEGDQLLPQPDRYFAVGDSDSLMQHIAELESARRSA